jgi:hypothetical protein
MDAEELDEFRTRCAGVRARAAEAHAEAVRQVARAADLRSLSVETRIALEEQRSTRRNGGPSHEQ